MEIAFGFDDKPTLTPHQAVGAGALLRAVGTPAALAAAAKIDDQATTAAELRQDVLLTDEEKAVLLDALIALADRALPEQLEKLKAELAIELGR